MSVNRHGCRILSISLALALGASTGCAPAAAPKSHARRDLGVLRLNDPFAPRKMVIIRGTILSGEIRATYADGVSFLDSTRWRWIEPAKTRRPGPNSFDADLLSEAALAMFADVPAVNRMVAEGTPRLRAIERYVERQQELVLRVRDTYRAALAANDPDPEAAARRVIDPDLAVAGGEGEQAPIILPSSISLHFHGFGRYSMLTPQANPDAPPRPTVLTLTAAQADFAQLERLLALPAPVVVVESASSRITYTGEDALRAFAEIDSLRSAGGRDIRGAVTDTIGALPEPVRDEISSQLRERSAAWR